MPVASVIITAQDAASTLQATLEALARQDVAEPYEVIVVDNGSSDATSSVARLFQAPARMKLKVVRGPGEGAGVARNVGCERSGAPIMAFTDADCRPDPGWLANGIESLRDADLVQGAVTPVEGVEPRPFDRTLWVVAEVGLYETANLFVTRELFERLGGFVDWLGPVAGRPLAEDFWLGWRARRSGAKTKFSATALVRHEVFRRGMADFVAERRRLQYFPYMARKVPELRTSMFFGRVFLNRRSAAFDGAVAGLMVTALLRSRLTLVAVFPYAGLCAQSALRWRRHAPRVLVGELLADGLGLIALTTGSIRARRLVL